VIAARVLVGIGVSKVANWHNGRDTRVHARRAGASTASCMKVAAQGVHI